MTSAVYEPGFDRGFRRYLIGTFRKRRDVVVVYAVLIAMVVSGALLSSDFLTSFNIQSLCATATALALVSIGQTFVVLTGGIDLSVGSTMSLTTVMAAMYMNGSNGKLWPAVGLCVCIGLGIGLLNGLIITVLRVEPIIATLGMMSAVQGLTFVRSMRPSGLTSPLLTNLVYETVLRVPKPLILTLIAFGAGIFVLRRTRYGIRVYAVGGSEESARLSGIPVIRIKLSVYMISGAFAALAGLFLSARLGQGDPLSGQTFMLSSIAAVTIGGTNLFGGRGGLAGTLAGVFVLVVLANLLNLEGVATYPQQLISGLLIIGVVAIYSASGVRMSRLGLHRRAGES